MLGCAHTPRNRYVLPSAAGIRTLWRRCSGPRRRPMASGKNLFDQEEKRQESSETCSSRFGKYVRSFDAFHLYCYDVYWLLISLWNHTGNLNYFKEQSKSCFSVLSVKNQAFLCLDPKGMLYTSVSNVKGNSYSIPRHWDKAVRITCSSSLGMNWQISVTMLVKCFWTLYILWSFINHYWHHGFLGEL